MIIQSNSSPNISCLARELEAFNQLKHPCMVPLYGFSPARSESPTALVMKVMPNSSLAKVLNRMKRESHRASGMIRELRSSPAELPLVSNSCQKELFIAM
jgi:serine/threonine protein kinase